MVDFEKIQKKTSKFEKKYQEHEEKDHWGALWSLGWRVALEWGSAVLISYFLGYGFDKFLGTSPWGIIVFLLIGNIAGLINIYRTYKKTNVDSF